MRIAPFARRQPGRIAAGAFILNSGIGKWSADEETATRLHAMAAGTYPILGRLSPKDFVRLLAAGEIALGSALLHPAAVSGTRVGESYDLIIGLDGERITNYLDFSRRMNLARAGELVYLSVSRNGKRMQIPVRVPVFSAATFGAR